MRKTTMLIALLAASASAHAANEKRPAASNECVFIRSVHDFRPLDRNHLIIWSPGRRDAYLVEVAGSLPELKFAQRLAVVDRNGDGRLCGYGMDRLIADSSSSFPATVVGMTRLDDEGLAEIEAKYDVRLTRKPAERADPES